MLGWSVWDLSGEAGEVERGVANQMIMCISIGTYHGVMITGLEYESRPFQKV